MEVAASIPAATAAMAIYGPLTTSPPAKTPSRLVAKVSGSAAMRPRLSSTPSASVRNDRFVFWPMAMMTTSQSWVLSLSSK